MLLTKVFPFGRIRRRARQDQGYAMLMVIGSMLALSLIVTAALSFAQNDIPVAKHEQNYDTALAAAQAGVQDMLAHLNTCDSYWALTTSACYNTAQAASPNKALQPNTSTPDWTNYGVNVPGTSQTSPAKYLYEIVGRPDSTTTPGVVRIKAWGKVGSVTRTVQADFNKQSFLNFIYYTDYESTDPTTLTERFPAATAAKCTDTSTLASAVNCSWAGLTAAQTQQCALHYWEGRSTASMKENFTSTSTGSRPSTTTKQIADATCDIQFAAGDRINGPLHTNDAPLVGSGGATFTSPQTETYWGFDSTSSQYNAPPANGPYYRNGGGTPAGNDFVQAGAVTMPPANTALKALTQAPNTGCLYTGPTSITLNATGTMTVVSQNSTTATGTAASCLGTNVALPANGVIYVQNVSGTPVDCIAPWAGPYPMANDNGWRKYDCSAGDVFLQGTLKGQLTIEAQNDIDVVNNVVYNGTGGASSTALAGNNVLGLIADNFVEAYHPVSCTDSTTGLPVSFRVLGACTNLTPPGASGPLTSLTIQAAILSLQHSFRVQNFDLGADLSDGGTTNRLHIFGAIAQKYRGIVRATAVDGSTHGYIKDYNFDSRLRVQSPPYFITPANAPWQLDQQSEQ